MRRHLPNSSHDPLRDRHRPAAKLPGRAGHIPASREPARIGPLTVCAARGLRLVAAMPLTGWWSMDSRFRRPRHQSGDQVLEPEECGRRAFGYASPGRSGRETPSSSSWGGRLSETSRQQGWGRHVGYRNQYVWAVDGQSLPAASAAAEDHGPASCLPVQTDRGHDGSVQSKRGTVRVGLVAELS